MFLSSKMLITFQIALLRFPWCYIDCHFSVCFFPSPLGRRAPVNPNQTLQQDSAACAALGPRQSLRPHHWRGPAGKHPQGSPRVLWCRFRWERRKAVEKSSFYVDCCGHGATPADLCCRSWTCLSTNVGVFPCTWTRASQNSLWWEDCSPLNSLSWWSLGLDFLGHLQKANNLTSNPKSAVTICNSLQNYC